MLQCLASSITNDVKQNIKNSKFIGVLTDESCDIAVLKKTNHLCPNIKWGKGQC